MILKEKSLDIITSGDFQETSFSLDTDSEYLIFEILRSKIYKNNIGSICREISCNGRDTQREIGDFTTPIEIEISDKTKSLFIEDGLNIIFRDFGTGISPDRVRTIYTKYGASTKRNDNIQTGGFGLGAKTPFSYTDAFTLRTIYDGVEYLYSLYIDNSKKGKMALLDYKESTEKNMTEVIIPLKIQDLDRFKTEIIRNTYFWDVKPKLINFGRSEYPEMIIFKHKIFSEDILYVKNNYAIITPFSFSEGPLSVIIDGIYYPVDLNLVNKNVLNAGRRLEVCLWFNTGELNISSNRENLQYDDDTIKAINERLEEISKHIFKEYEKTITNSKNILAANSMLNNITAYDDCFAMFKFLAPNIDYVDKNSKKYSLKHGYSFKIDSLKTIMSVFKNEYNTIKRNEINDLASGNLCNVLDKIYLINKEKNYSSYRIYNKFAKFSQPILRTLINRHPQGFIVIAEEDIKNQKSNKLKELIDMGIEFEYFEDVPPTKIKREKTIKKKNTIIFKTYRASSHDQQTYTLNDNGKIEPFDKTKKFITISVINEISNPKLNKDYLMKIFEIISKDKAKYESIIIVSEKKKKYIDDKFCIPIEKIFDDHNEILSSYMLKDEYGFRYDLAEFEDYMDTRVLNKYPGLIDWLNKIKKLTDSYLPYGLTGYLINILGFKLTRQFDIEAIKKDIEDKYKGIGKPTRKQYINLIDELNEYKQKFGQI